MPGKCGAGHGRCAGTVCSPWCDEAAAESHIDRRRRKGRLPRKSPARPFRQSRPPRRPTDQRMRDRAAGAATGRSRSASAIASRTRPCSTARSRTFPRSRARATASAATSVSSFLATTCSASSFPTCCFAPFRRADEGELSRRLADLVRKETCAEIARAIDLGAAIRLGASEANAGARTRPAILADVCEALIGAVYLDGGFAAAEALVGRLWQVRMKHEGRAGARSENGPAGMGAGRAACRRRPIARSRAPARTTTRSFASPCSFRSLAPAEGSGRSKRAAEQAAAAAMMKREGVKPQRARWLSRRRKPNPLRLRRRSSARPMPENRRWSTRSSAPRSRSSRRRCRPPARSFAASPIDGPAQLILVDTPGIFAPRRRLDRAMVGTAWGSTQDADIVALVVDAPQGRRG